MSSSLPLPVAMALIGLCAAIASSAIADALTDPIPDAIEMSGITLVARNFLRAPQSHDTDTRSANRAWARIQYLQPIPGGSGRLVFNDTRGLLYLTDEDGRTPTVFLDLRKYGGFGFDDTPFPNEAGLAGFAFHPDFPFPDKPGYGRFYTAYSARSDSGIAGYLDDDSASHESVIREWTMSDPSAVRFSGASREIFRIGQFASNHNVGTLAFNPVAVPGGDDYGLLYAGFGDGGASNDPKEYGQSLAEPLGSIIRIDPLGGDHQKPYAIPADNPFAPRPDAAGEIWAYGLRHPQHFSWDEDGRMFIADIGQNQIEEVNIGRKGANYGWRLREGTFATSFGLAQGQTGAQPGRVYALTTTQDEFTYPLAQYDHDEGGAISSGFVYRGRMLPRLRGKYVFTDLVRGRLFFCDALGSREAGGLARIREIRIDVEGTGRSLIEAAAMPNTLAPGERVDLRLGRDARGELYLLTKSDGWIRTLELPAGPRVETR